MTNWANSIYSFPFTSTTFSSWWGKASNQSSVGEGITLGTGAFKTANNSGSTIGGYTIYELPVTGYLLNPPSSVFTFFSTNDGCLSKFEKNHFIKNPATNKTVNTKTYYSGTGIDLDGTPHFVYYAIKLLYYANEREYYYIISREEKQEVVISSEKSRVEPIPSSFEPYQTVAFTNTPSITLNVTTYNFDSASSTQSTQEQIKNPKWASSYTTPSEVKAEVSASGAPEKFYMTITISAWAHIEYSMVATGNTFSLYTGKIVGNDFLSAYKIKCRKYNNYGSSEIFPKTALELSKMSKTVITENDANFIFAYDISDITESATTSINSPIFTSIHRLASGANRFKNISRKKVFSLGDTIEALDVPNAGSLTYDDETTISLADIVFSNYSTTCSIGELPITVGVDTPSAFLMTYKMVSPYFGNLEFSDSCSTEASAQANRVEFVDYKTDFKPNEVITYGENAKLKVYNSANELLKTIESANLGTYVTNVDKRYGQLASNYLADGAIKLTFQAYGFEVEQIIYITYDEALLVLDTNSVKKRYIFDTSDTDFDFDYTGLVIGANRHVNSASGTQITLRNIALTDEKLSITHDPLDTHEGREYGISVSYTNEYGQKLSGSFSIYAEPLKPTKVIMNVPSVTPNSVKYYDNGKAKFKLPEGLTATIVYNDSNSNITITDLSDFEFFRDAEHNILLTVGASIISRADGNNIYVHSQTYNVDGYYQIVWVEDKITKIELESPINVYFGNKLNKSSVKSQISFKTTYESGEFGVINNANDFTFKLSSIIFEEPTKEQCEVVLTNIGTFKIDNYDTHVIWHKPYASMSFNTTNFQTEYNNNVDIIYPQGIVAIVSYYEDEELTIPCEYSETCSYSSEATSLYNKFVVTGEGKLLNYNFGSQVLNVSMEGVSKVEGTIKASANNRFYSTGSNAVVSNTLIVSIVEILNITGIKLLNAKTEYNVGERFLNENDDTRIMIFYNDAQNNPKTYSCYLRSGLTALNIYPLKGTKLTQIVNNKVVTISSATNYNVNVQYSINVKANYFYSDTKKHNLVAIFLTSYECPDGVSRSKYFLVERAVNVNGQVVEKTTIDSESGERVIADGFDVSDLDVYGYLEDIGDSSLNARVILFKDYIAPIEGSNNITVKFPCYVKGNADLINKCHFGIMFGNNNSKNRLFVSGNKDYKNKDWHSGQVDSSHTDDETMLTGNYGYFEDLSECVYGETDNAVIGYDIVSNDKLLVLKNYSDKETTIYFRQPQLVTAINSSGTAVTDLDDETLYQEEFSLSKGNNSVAGINPRGILNFNGDSLFISHDKQVVGLDLTGIVGDNQRYANSRSYFIDEELKNHDLSKSFLWSNNKYLYLVLDDSCYVSHFETKHDSQYEWYLVDIGGVSSILEIGGTFYFGRKDGTLYKMTKGYVDAKKVFAGYGITRLSANEKTELITASGYLDKLDSEKTYYFKPIPLTDMGKDDDPYIYYSLGLVRNDTTSDCDFYVDNSNENNVIELVCNKNGVTDIDRMDLLLKRISENEPVYLNKIDSTENGIACQSGSVFENAYGKKFYLREYSDSALKHLYQVIDENGNVMPVSELYRARLCYRLTSEAEMANINVNNGTFQLKRDDEILDIVQYSNQSLITAFRGEIIEYSNVEAFYITKPYTMGNLEYLKTIWSFTLTNDTNLPSELELCYATNKIPYEEMKTIAKISVSKEALGFSFANLSFSKVDFDKNIVPRTYTHKRILSGVKFVCFGFRNYKDSNSVLSSMTVTYTVPYPSYSGD